MVDEREPDIRIGIDVGGTFTHAVAVNGQTLAVIGKAKVLTTHRAPEGVALGVVESLKYLLSANNIAPDAVRFIAHSTTQATNSLLEGDVAPVGVLGMGSGRSAYVARLSTNIGNIELAPGKYLMTSHCFLDTSTRPDRSEIWRLVEGLRAAGCRAIAISEAFSVDDPANEQLACEVAAQVGLPATCGSEITGLYGLKLRTRTTAINASMLPKMIESAELTQKAVRDSGIFAPIMIMRSDGGVMDIEAMRKRPILTMLSGPAAGVAAALMYLHISDGVFIEVGGTSTDISAIKNGKALIKSAQVGGKRICARTLDVITVGAAGGSIPRLHGNKIIDVGPRSAHIAGMGYVSFEPPAIEPVVQLIQPSPEDPADYLAIAEGAANEPHLCLTTTCAANFLKLVPVGDCAYGNTESIERAFKSVSEKTGVEAQPLANKILSLAAHKCIPAIEQFIEEYKLSPEILSLVGGGGGAAAIVPYTAAAMSIKFRLAKDADVISAIGVALSLLRDTVERQCINPTNEDIFKVREEAYLSVQKMGADPASIETTIEIDNRNKVIRATATGATRSRTDTGRGKILSAEELARMASASLRVDLSKVSVLAATDQFTIFGAEVEVLCLGGLLRRKQRNLRVVDRVGVVRLQLQNGSARLAPSARIGLVLNEMAEELSEYGNAGRMLPNMLVLAGSKIIDLSGLAELNQMTGLAHVELESFPPDQPVCVLASKH